MAGLRETTAVGVALGALLAMPVLLAGPEPQAPVVSPVAPVTVAEIPATPPAETPALAEAPAAIPSEPAPDIAEAAPIAAPLLLAELPQPQVPLRLTLQRLPDLSALPRAEALPALPSRVMLAGADTPTGAAPAAPLTGAVLPRSPAEILAQRRGLSMDDVRVQIDMRPAAVTFWVGSAAKDGILRDIATQPWNADWGADVFYGVSYSQRIGRLWTDIAVDIEAGGGYRAGDTNSPEAWIALYGRYDGFPWRNRLYTSIAFSTGLHWMNNLPESETGTAAQPEPNQSKLLHYLSPEITFSLPNYLEHEVAIRYAHRSGVFGTFNGVWGGSNVLTIGYRRRL
jgi:hypothetical protein